MTRCVRTNRRSMINISMLAKYPTILKTIRNLRRSDLPLVVPLRIPTKEHKNNVISRRKTKIKIVSI